MFFKFEVEFYVDFDGVVNVGVGEGELGFVLFGVCEDGGVGCVVIDDFMGWVSIRVRKGSGGGLFFL